MSCTGVQADCRSRLARLCEEIFTTCSLCRNVRMAYLAVVASHSVNGVAAIHSDIIQNSVFRDFAQLWPHKFQNKTNGVTPRRWLAFCNPPLRALISQTLGSDSWINQLPELQVASRSGTDLAGQRAQADSLNRVHACSIGRLLGRHQAGG